MALILDGYNVIGALSRYQQTDNFAAAREFLGKRHAKGGGLDGAGDHPRLRRPPQPGRRDGCIYWPAVRYALSTAPRPNQPTTL